MLLCKYITSALICFLFCWQSYILVPSWSTRKGSSILKLSILTGMTSSFGYIVGMSLRTTTSAASGASMEIITKVANQYQEEFSSFEISGYICEYTRWIDHCDQRLACCSYFKLAHSVIIPTHFKLSKRKSPPTRWWLLGWASWLSWPNLW